MGEPAPSTKLRVEVVQDPRLSLRARGIYGYLMTLPSDVTPTPREIARGGPESVDAIRRALAELEACGYIEPVGIAAPRISIPLGLRYKTLRRDGYVCRYCGARAPEATLVVDHVVPVTLNGKTVLENLLTACDPCNTGKSGQAPEPWLVEEVKRRTGEWLASAAAEADPEDMQMTRPKGRGHVKVRVRR
jgi:hypothetical protein